MNILVDEFQKSSIETSTKLVPRCSYCSSTFTTVTLLNDSLRHSTNVHGDQRACSVKNMGGRTLNT